MATTVQNQAAQREEVAQSNAIHNRGGFFSDYFIGSLQDERAFKGLLGDETRAQAYNRLRALYRRQLNRLGEGSTVAQTRRDWLLPLFETLGFHNPAGCPLQEGTAVEVEGSFMHTSHEFLPEGAEAPACLIDLLAWGQGLDESAPGGRARLTPHRRMLALLDARDVRWGLLANGDVIRLVRRDEEGAGLQYLEVAFEPLLLDGDEDAFAIFWALFRAQAFLAEGGQGCLLDRVRELSEKRGTRVSQELGESVVETLGALMRGLLGRRENWTPERLGQFYTRQGDGYANEAGDLSEADLSEVYRQGLVLLFRMLFVLYAESRKLVPVDVPAYAEQYGIERLRERLLESGSEWHAGGQRVWRGLRAITQIMREGLPAAEFNVPAFNGRLFAADEAPLLECCSIGDDVMRRVMLGLTMTRPKAGKAGAAGLDRISYRELGVEQLGAVYEGLLDFEPSVAREAMLLTRQKKAVDVRPLRELDSVSDGGEHFAPGEFYLDPTGGARRGTGTYYTPREFTTTLVERALGPQVEGRSSEEILELKILDPAMGSGAFLIAACDFLAERYLEALDRERAGALPGEDDEPAEPSEDREARLARARRLIAERCLYGVDKNPMAVQLAHVSLWMATLAGDRPLTFLDHHLRSGDSLVGARLAELEEPVPDACLSREARARNKKFALGFRGLSESGALGALIETLLRHREELAGDDETVEAVRRKDRLLHEDLTGEAYQRVKDCLDLRSALWFWPESGGAPLDTARFRDALNALMGLPTTLSNDEIEKLRRQVREVAAEQRFFHEDLEFPELYWAPDGRRLSDAEAGFDVVLGNPPFVAGGKISSTLGADYLNYLHIAYKPVGGQCDLCAYFYRRGFGLLQYGGDMGMLATNTISQGDTREGGLAVIVQKGGTITLARRFVKWPGTASVEINLLVIRNGSSGRPALLDSRQVSAITARLDDGLGAEPTILITNADKSFKGTDILGVGFLLEPQQAQALIDNNAKNREVLSPYLNGEDLNSRADQSPRRWVINFRDWPLARAEAYPDCWRIIEDKVRPGRQRRDARGEYVLSKPLPERYWNFNRTRPQLYATIASMDRLLVRAEVSELHQLSFVSHGLVYSHMLYVFAFDDDYHFALLQSNAHEGWIRRLPSTMRTDFRYTPRRHFETFPFPVAPEEQAQRWAGEIGGVYHEHRRQLMLRRWIGLTPAYNLFNNRDCQDEDIVRLRELHAQMDRAILACYGWQDLDPAHGFHKTDRGQTRYTVSPEARRELLRRLLALNLELATKEEALGQAPKRAKRHKEA